MLIMSQHNHVDAYIQLYPVDYSSCYVQLEKTIDTDKGDVSISGVWYVLSNLDPHIHPNMSRYRHYKECTLVCFIQYCDIKVRLQ